MSQIDLDKVGAALSFLRDDNNGAVALKQLRTAMDSFIAAVKPSLSYPESVFLFRTLMSDLSIDYPDGVPNAGPVVAGVQALGTPTKNVHGFHVVVNK